MRSPDPLRPSDSIFAQPEDDSRFNLVCTRIAAVMLLGMAAINLIVEVM